MLVVKLSLWKSFNFKHNLLIRTPNEVIQNAMESEDMYLQLLFLGGFSNSNVYMEESEYKIAAVNLGPQP